MKNKTLYRAGPLMNAIYFMKGTKYDCNASYYWDKYDNNLDIKGDQI